MGKAAASSAGPHSSNGMPASTNIFAIRSRGMMSTSRKARPHRLNDASPVGSTWPRWSAQASQRNFDSHAAAMPSQVE